MLLKSTTVLYMYNFTECSEGAWSPSQGYTHNSQTLVSAYLLLSKKFVMCILNGRFIYSCVVLLEVVYIICPYGSQALEQTIKIKKRLFSSQGPCWRQRGIETEISLSHSIWWKTGQSKRNYIVSFVRFPLF